MQNFARKCLEAFKQDLRKKIQDQIETRKTLYYADKVKSDARTLELQWVLEILGDAKA